MNVASQFPQYTTSVDSDQKSETLPLLQARDFLIRQWRLIALVTALTAIVGIAYIAVVPSRYTAHADMVIDTKRITCHIIRGSCWDQNLVWRRDSPVRYGSIRSGCVSAGSTLRLQRFDIALQID